MPARSVPCPSAGAPLWFLPAACSLLGNEHSLCVFVMRWILSLFGGCSCLSSLPLHGRGASLSAVAPHRLQWLPEDRTGQSKAAGRSVQDLVQHRVEEAKAERAWPEGARADGLWPGGAWAEDLAWGSQG